MLTKLGVKFRWNKAQQKAFEEIQDLIITDPILQYPDFKKPFIVTTDASDYAIGAILSQGKIGEDLPVAYASRTFLRSRDTIRHNRRRTLSHIIRS